MEDKKQEGMQDLGPEEMEKTAGGSIIDDVKCFFGSHEWSVAPIRTKGCGKVPHIYFECYKCKNCEKLKYVKSNTKTGEEKEITKEEFDKAQF